MCLIYNSRLNLLINLFRTDLFFFGRNQPATDGWGVHSILCARLKWTARFVVFPPLLTTFLLHSLHSAPSAVLSKYPQTLLLGGGISALLNNCTRRTHCYVILSMTYLDRSNDTFFFVKRLILIVWVRTVNGIYIRIKSFCLCKLLFKVNSKYSILFHFIKIDK